MPFTEALRKGYKLLRFAGVIWVVLSVIKRSWLFTTFLEGFQDIGRKELSLEEEKVSPSVMLLIILDRDISRNSRRLVNRY
jgi:hypothetical protein